MSDGRTEHGTSQERLGELAKVHRMYVEIIERGEKNIILTNIEKFARALGMNVKRLS